jgi:hypothetical protein
MHVSGVKRKCLLLIFLLFPNMKLLGNLFHRLRMDFLETYQQLILTEPESAISQPLKEAFLALRQVAESGKGDE